MDSEGSPYTKVQGLIEKCGLSLEELMSTFRQLIWGHLCICTEGDNLNCIYTLLIADVVKEKKGEVLRILDQLTEITESPGFARVDFYQRRNIAIVIDDYRSRVEAISPQIEMYLLISGVSRRELSLSFLEKNQRNKIFQILARLGFEKYKQFLITLRTKWIQERYQILHLYGQIMKHPYFPQMSESLKERIINKKQEISARDFL